MSVEALSFWALTTSIATVTANWHSHSYAFLS